MSKADKLLNLKEVSKILNINTEVLRRWLRNKKIIGTKVGSDWRVSENTLNEFVNKGQNAPKEAGEDTPKMCYKFPKWLEFSGLPEHLNNEYGLMTWSIFKKIIEIDVETANSVGTSNKIDYEEFALRVGYKISDVIKIIGILAVAGYISIDSTDDSYIAIKTPIKTPKLILDISYENGGIKGAPVSALKNSCMRRFLESAP